jgi:excisionase family DNA binding protein
MSIAAIEKSFCTTREAATLLGVSVGTVQLWVESGLLQAWKTTGGHRRVIRDSVERLLRKVPATPSTASTPTAASTPRQLNVMVVENDPDLLRLYQTLLSRWPMRPSLTCLDNAVSALMMLGRGGPDLLVTDLHMPGMDGFAMLRVLSQAPEMNHTQIVVVTGLDAPAIAAQGGVPQGIEILSKPIPFERLLAIATGIVNQSSFQLP